MEFESICQQGCENNFHKLRNYLKKKQSVASYAATQYFLYTVSAWEVKGLEKVDENRFQLTKDLFLNWLCF